MMFIVSLPRTQFLGSLLDCLSFCAAVSFLYTSKRFMRAWNKIVLTHLYLTRTKPNQVGPCQSVRWVSKQGVGCNITKSMWSIRRVVEEVLSTLALMVDTESVGRQRSFACSTLNIRKWGKVWLLWAPEDATPGVGNKVHRAESRNLVGNVIEGLFTGLIGGSD